MADPFSWTDLGRALLSLSRYVPDQLLRLAWSDTKLLARIETFHFDQAPRFYVRSDSDNPRLLHVGFNVFNFTPFTLVIVGADVRLSLDSREFLRYDSRFSAEIPMAPRARSGFLVPGVLSEAQVARVRSYPAEWAIIQVSGAMVLRTPFGERRKEVNAHVVATIDR